MPDPEHEPPRGVAALIPSQTVPVGGDRVAISPLVAATAAMFLRAASERELRPDERHLAAGIATALQPPG